MSKIVFFCIPAHGHTNPTIEVVKQLTDRNHEVLYYSFNEFKEKIEYAGAKFISCDDYLPELKAEDEKKVGKDFSALIEMVVDTTLALDEKVCRELDESKPDCIVSDSICFWGKLFAMKMKIPYVCSTTTFAFNDQTSKMIKQGFGEIMRMVLGIRKINKKLNLLREHGYEIENFIDLVKNDNNTNTIVYTSKEFQPMVDAFSEKYSFIGPSISNITAPIEERNRKKIYISMGTVNNKNIKFYKNCIKAFENEDIDIIMSVGKDTVISDLENIPYNFKVEHSVKQVIVLQNADLFITHCGMNSVNESLYYGVPMVLFPQHSEQNAVAKRVATIGAGIFLRKNNPKDIKESAWKVISNEKYKENAKKISISFKNAGGAKKGADAILKVIEESLSRSI